MTLNRSLRIALLSASALAFPAVSAAATHKVTGTVLASSTKSHTVEVVSGRGAVRTYHVAGKSARGLRRGARVSFSSAHGSAAGLKVVAHARSVTFLGKVVRSRGGALVVAIGDGSRISLAAAKRHAKHKARRGHARAHAAQDVSVNVTGLAPGQTVLITLTLSPAGDELGITIHLVAAPPATQTSADQQQSGTVVAVDEDNGVVTVDDGSGNTTDLTLSDALLATTDELPSECDTVTVSYHADPADPSSLVADSITTTGTDDTCDSSSSDGSGGDSDQEVLGTLSAIDPVAGTITVSTPDGQSLVIGADPTMLGGLGVGDQVDVLYAQADDGSLQADDVSAPDDGSGDSNGGSDG
jgi:hypothetical protein